ncbi:MAG TPA: tRNA (adenosine(37)-N6)-threonylcarbamoyltransferase complex dimerization subunit type 1 TsaB [Burkholderiales bacterium]|nr:tRNA (adenosine(37)-N6)-threonylcarbamoyltransferase complex dimerization subunit type 1 TsaB [Burkholderiales bacterium]
MRIAAFETSGDWCSVALSLEGELRGRELRAGTRHSEFALPMLQALLAEARLKASDLQAVAFGAGPGSFTGLRIACGIAQGLALARDLPVLGISSFEAIAEEAAAPRVVACVDARMREVYYAALEKRGTRWVEVVTGRCVPPQEVPAPPGAGWIGCGSGFVAFPDLLKGSLAAVQPEVHPTAMAVATLALPRLAAGEGVDAALALPVYLRDKVAFTQQELASR